MKTIRKITFLFIFGILVVFPSKISAHVLKYDGSIGAVLHVNPDDDPIAGESTNFFFEFKDKDNKFVPDGCDCKAIITENGKQIYSADLFAGKEDPSLTDISFSFVFPATDIYKLTITGTPKTPDAFQKFSLSYDIRVARTNGSVAHVSADGGWWHNHIWHVVTSLGIGVVTLFVYISSNKKKSK